MKLPLFSPFASYEKIPLEYPKETFAVLWLNFHTICNYLIVMKSGESSTHSHKSGYWALADIADRCTAEAGLYLKGHSFFPLTAAPNRAHLDGIWSRLGTMCVMGRNLHFPSPSQLGVCEATEELGATCSHPSDAVVEVRAGADGFVCLRPVMGALVSLLCTEQILNPGQQTLSSEGCLKSLIREKLYKSCSCTK